MSIDNPKELNDKTIEGIIDTRKNLLRKFLRSASGDRKDLLAIGKEIFDLLDDSVQYHQESYKSQDQDNISQNDQIIENNQDSNKQDAKLPTELDLTEQQLLDMQAEFEEIVKELYSLLAEIGGLLSELGNPPDKQKLILLKEKLKALSHARAKMRHLSWKIPPKYQKAFNFEYYFAQIEAFLKDNKQELSNLGKNSNLASNDLMVKELQLILERESLFESAQEELARLQEELDVTTDAKLVNDITVRMSQIVGQLKTLEIEIEQHKQALLESTVELKGNQKAVAVQRNMELAAAGMFAELNGLILGQSFENSQVLEGHSMNFHKTMEEILDSFDMGVLLVDNIQEVRATLDKSVSVSSPVLSADKQAVQSSQLRHNNIVENVVEGNNDMSNDKANPEPIISNDY